VITPGRLIVGSWNARMSLWTTLRSILTRRTPLGARGERAAAKFLARAGYSIIARNARTRVGEADLVCLAPDGRTIVIVEVKTRLAVEPGAAAVPPEANITPHKRMKLLQVTRLLIAANNWRDRPVRIDVIAIEWPRNDGEPILRHHVDALR
jgi:putative endonuclease